MAVSEKQEPKHSRLHEQVSSQIEPFFETTLRRMQLTAEQIQLQSKEELANSLSIVEDAIKSPASFGVLKVAVSAKVGLYIVDSSSKHIYEVGILPLLLESKNLILQRLAGFGADISQAERILHDKTVETMKKRIAKLDLMARLSGGLVLWVACLFLIIKLPSVFNWSWFIGHQNVTGLSLLALVVCTGLIWAGLEVSSNRRWFALGSIVIAALIGAITIV